MVQTFSYVKCNYIWHMDFYFVCLCTDNFLPQLDWFVYLKLYYLQLFTIIAYYLNAHIMLFDMSYVITFDIWEIRIMSYYILYSWRKCKMWKVRKDYCVWDATSYLLYISCHKLSATSIPKGLNSQAGAAWDENWPNHRKENQVSAQQKQNSGDFQVTHQAPCSDVGCYFSLVALFCFPDVRTPCANIMTTYRPGPGGSKKRGRARQRRMWYQKIMGVGRRSKKKFYNNGRIENFQPELA